MLEEVSRSFSRLFRLDLFCTLVVNGESQKHPQVIKKRLELKKSSNLNMKTVFVTTAFPLLCSAGHFWSLPSATDRAWCSESAEAGSETSAKKCTRRGEWTRYRSKWPALLDLQAIKYLKYLKIVWSHSSLLEQGAWKIKPHKKPSLF